MDCPSLSPGPAFPWSAAPLNRKTLSSIAVIQFTPAGGARISASPVGAIGVGLQPLKGPCRPDADNRATVWISGLTGLSTVYRP